MWASFNRCTLTTEIKKKKTTPQVTAPEELEK